MHEVSDPASFACRFGGEPQIAAAAPGRVNLIGEHTDYHQGFVLPMSLPQRTVVTLRRRADYMARVVSTAMIPSSEDYIIGDESPRSAWIDYVQGATWVLERSGRLLTGFDATIESTLPPGGGVSSSAALTVALLRALSAINHLKVGPVEIAHLAHQIETDFVGAPVGIMDQMACSLCRANEALFLDTRSLSFERLAWPANIEVMVIHSGLSHSHAGGDYARRRRESFSAAGLLGVRWLRDATEAKLARTSLPDVMKRRARHVITENQRVLAAVDALRQADARRLGALLNESHASMRDDYEISVPEIDALVALGQADPDVYGARLTGGGFGGCVVMLAAAGQARAAANRIVATYRRNVGRAGAVLVPVNREVMMVPGGATS
jgi:galactokinase